MAFRGHPVLRLRSVGVRLSFAAAPYHRTRLSVPASLLLLQHADFAFPRAASLHLQGVIVRRHFVLGFWRRCGPIFPFVRPAHARQHCDRLPVSSAWIPGRSR